MAFAGSESPFFAALLRGRPIAGGDKTETRLGIGAHDAGPSPPAANRTLTRRDRRVFVPLVFLLRPFRNDPMARLSAVARCPMSRRQCKVHKECFRRCDPGQVCLFSCSTIFPRDPAHFGRLEQCICCGVQCSRYWRALVSPIPEAVVNMTRRSKFVHLDIRQKRRR